MYGAYSFIMILFVFYGVLILGWLAGYILRGIGIMKLSATLGRRNGWLGFIPFAKDYQVGQMAGDIEIGERKVKNPGLWMALLPVIVNAVFFVVYIGLIFSTTFRAALEASNYYYYDFEDVFMDIFGQFFVGIILIYLLVYAGGVLISLFRLLALHRIFGYFYQGQRPVFYLVLSTFVPFAESILMIRTAKRQVINPPDYPFETAYYAPQPYGQPYPGQPYQQGYPPQQPYGPYDQQQGYQAPQQQQWQDYGQQPPYGQPQEPQYPQYPPQAAAGPAYPPPQNEPADGAPLQPQAPAEPQPGAGGEDNRPEE